MPRALLLLVLTVVLAGCGGERSSTGGGGSGTAKPTQLPAVQVADLRSDEQLSLRTLTAADKPLLVWFWAPY